jgi:ribulose-phosphate 3-epimerase
MQVIPTITERDFYKAEERIEKVSVYSRWIQVDVFDDVFCSGKSFELELLGKLQMTTDKLLWDVHLLVKGPQDWIEKCLFIGANRIVGQVEMLGSRELFIRTIKDEGLEAGLAFDIDTKIDEDIPSETDIIILMGRKAGFGDFEMDKKVFKKIEILRQAQDKRERKFLIAVDGGVDTENVMKLKDAGVDVIYSGGSYFQIKDVS